MTKRQTRFPLRQVLRTGFFVAATVFYLVAMAGAVRAQVPPHSLEISRTVRPWEFLPVTGMRAGLLGDESGRMEAWVYPLKILREFHLKFRTEEFVPLAGVRAGWLGDESGRREAWVAPLKILREFHLEFRTNRKCSRQG